MNGKVILVGAGPGDPELLTLKAVRALAGADVVLHDDLVPTAILAFARDGARIVGVGKRGGCRSTPQAFIGELMIREARAGRVVVRLKGGDPFVFGRGGEEIAALREAGIAVEVVPGITSGLAAPAAAGIAVTHREMARGVALVTGHTANGDEPDWRALVAARVTLVIYMGTRRAGDLQEALLAAGMRPDMPVAVIANATRPDERRAFTELRALAQAALPSPALIVVGETVGLALEGYAGSRTAAGAEVQISCSTSSSARISGSLARWRG